MYLPGFEAIAKDLNTSISEVSLSLSSFFVGISFGQLLYGPLLDKFGRKKPLYCGLGIYLLTSVLCAFTTSVEMFIALRFFQAVGSCAAGVASLAMVRDLFPVKDSAKVFSLLMLVVGTSPMLAPLAGKYVTAAYGWHSIFIILTGIAVLIMGAIFFFLPESSPPNPAYSLKPKPILKNFYSVIKEPQFFTYAIAGAVAFSGLFVYVSASPQIFLEIYRVGPDVYIWIFALLSVGFIGSSYLNSFVVKKHKSERIIFISLTVMCVSNIFFLTGSLNSWFGLPVNVALLFVMLSCLGFSFPNSSALSLAPFSYNAGSASALMGFLQMAFGALASAAVSMLSNGTMVPIVTVITAASLISFTILLVSRKRIKTQPVITEDFVKEQVHF
jgi:DHA1 family bicyclomycin/chloramphenicol resistance-like MFS transporter